MASEERVFFYREGVKQDQRKSIPEVSFSLAAELKRMLLLLLFSANFPRRNRLTDEEEKRQEFPS